MDKGIDDIRIYKGIEDHIRIYKGIDDIQDGYWDRRYPGWIKG